MDPLRRRFVLRKLHSLSGLVPVGLFMLVHLWTNAKALRGQAAFDEAVGEINHLPYLPLLEAGILLPLAFHAGYGIKLALEARPNVGAYPSARNWMYTLQRVTGIVALFFLLFHLWELRVQKALGVMPIAAFYPTLCAHLSSTVAGIPLVALVYLVGLAASVFHFANGVWGFLCSWGITLTVACSWIPKLLGPRRPGRLRARSEHHPLLRHRRAGLRAQLAHVRAAETALVCRHPHPPPRGRGAWERRGAGRRRPIKPYTA